MRRLFVPRRRLSTQITKNSVSAGVRSLPDKQPLSPGCVLVRGNPDVAIAVLRQNSAMTECVASQTFPAAPAAPGTPIECPVCGASIVAGYAGAIPLHEPPANASLEPKAQRAFR
jgi:hypothetical protein